MMLLTFDPGVKALGWSLFVDSVLTDCGLLKADSLEDMLRRAPRFFAGVPDACVVEKPAVYPQRFWKGDANDLIQIALVAGAVASTYGTKKLVFVTPHTWKGNRPKEVDNNYTVSLLTDVEKPIAARVKLPKTLIHNVRDSIGLGLWHLGRR